MLEMFKVRKPVKGPAEAARPAASNSEGGVK
jgi:hypothetical protein